MLEVFPLSLNMSPRNFSVSSVEFDVNERVHRRVVLEVEALMRPCLESFYHLSSRARRIISRQPDQVKTSTKVHCRKQVPLIECRGQERGHSPGNFGNFAAI